MVLDLKQLFGTSNGAKTLDAEFDLSDVEFSGVFPIKTPVRITGEILSKTGIVFLRALIEADYSADCDRCGTPSTKHYSIPVNRVLVTELANEEENDEMLVLPEMKLDLYELVLTEVVLNVPSKHLCKEDCKGICQKCGKNLNEGPCECNHKEVDPRLAVLLDLLKDDE